MKTTALSVMTSQSLKNQTISIIVTTKNEEKNILRCLSSITLQRNKKNIEIIIVDNFSEDKTKAICLEFIESKKKLFKDIIFIEKGYERSTQRNKGAEKATGDYLLFLDADMELNPSVTSECLAIAHNKIIDPIIVVSEEAVGTTFLGRALALERNCYKNANWLQAARFFPRRFFLKIGGFDTKMIAGEDWDLTQRFREQGFPAFTTKKSFVKHYESTSSIFELLKKEKYYIKNLEEYARRHPHAFSYQGSFLYRVFIWVRSWNTLIQNPLLTITFLSYKFTVWCMWIWYKNKLHFTK